ncbi:MAG: sigma-70 family RNA polymerase sigma factor [Candidatus Micrarchaeota archaeon]|nr:sigma-70 family RNA polymerase sigma factor [Candidatus Micrarchaeota archaeon]
MAKNRLSDWQTLEKELTPHLKRNPKTRERTLPSKLYFQEIGRHDLAHAIVEKHGGFGTVRKKLGLPPGRLVGKESLMRSENLFAVLRPFIDKLGRLPTVRELQEAGERRTASALKEKRTEKVAELMQVAPKRRFGKWSLQIPANLIAAVREAGLTQLTQSEVLAAKRMDILRAIGKPGIREQMQGKFGMPITKRNPPSKYRTWENLQSELHKIQSFLGHFPTTSELAAMRRSDILYAIYLHHGGIVKVKEKHGIITRKSEAKPLSKPDLTLLEQAKTGNKQAIEKAFSRWEHLTKHATLHLRFRSDYADIKQEANIGLLEAIKRRKTNSGFGTYARRWIHGQVLDYLRTKAEVKITRIERAKLAYLGQRFEAFAQTHKRKPTTEELARETGYTESEIVELTKLAQAKQNPKTLPEEK